MKQLTKDEQIIGKTIARYETVNAILYDTDMMRLIFSDDTFVIFKAQSRSDVALYLDNTEYSETMIDNLKFRE